MQIYNKKKIIIIASIIIISINNVFHKRNEQTNFQTQPRFQKKLYKRYQG